MGRRWTLNGCYEVVNTTSQQPSRAEVDDSIKRRGSLIYVPGRVNACAASFERVSSRARGALAPERVIDVKDYLQGSCDLWLEYRERLRRLASSTATLLIQGESGSGKGESARALHAWGPRSSAPLVVLNVAALSPNLVESELFGHVRGSFTDAVRDRNGCFRRADTGTLVLDDVDLLPPEVQVKLLRVLQERVVEPVGSEEAVEVDVRVVATTNKILEQEVEEGRFREDLFYRLAVVTLDVPPLRARISDLGVLVRNRMSVLVDRLGVPAREVGEDALQRLERHPWPGNVRELENALERLLVLPPAGTSGAPIQVDELDFLDEAVAGGAHELARKALALGVQLSDLEVAMMDCALEEERGNVSAAARRVGMTRRAFEYRRARREEEAETGSETEAEA